MSIKCVIIDDEENNVQNLTQLLKLNCPGVTVIATANNASSGREVLLANKPDLVFLDIQMPGKTGLEMLKAMEDIFFEVIFVTAFDDYAIKAMKFSAIDYLLKPVDISELQDAVERAHRRINIKSQNNTLENLFYILNKEKNKNDLRIGLPTSKEIRFVRIEQIIRCESSNNYCTFFLANGEQILVCKPIYEYEQLLAEYGFLRCHQSHIINKNYIKSLVKESGGWFLMEDNKQVPISRAKKDILKTLF